MIAVASYQLTPDAARVALRQRSFGGPRFRVASVVSFAQKRVPPTKSTFTR
jgi:hypothetical protein